MLKLNSNIVVTYTGDVADFQHIQEMLEDEQREYDMRDDGTNLGHKDLHLHISISRRNSNGTYKADL